MRACTGPVVRTLALGTLALAAACGNSDKASPNQPPATVDTDSPAEELSVAVDTHGDGRPDGIDTHGDGTPDIGLNGPDAAQVECASGDFGAPDEQTGVAFDAAKNACDDQLDVWVCGELYLDFDASGCVTRFAEQNGSGLPSGYAACILEEMRDHCSACARRETRRHYVSCTIL